MDRKNDEWFLQEIGEMLYLHLNGTSDSRLADWCSSQHGIERTVKSITTMIGKVFLTDHNEESRQRSTVSKWSGEGMEDRRRRPFIRRERRRLVQGYSNAMDLNWDHDRTLRYLAMATGRSVDQVRSQLKELMSTASRKDQRGYPGLQAKKK
jgi:tRNA U34 5-carboxymethylaminomethyl modifying GTPase MnmE/TrmE